MNINRLKPHPAHKTIYTEPQDIREEWNDLVVSMEENGLLYPLIITEDNIIISGVRRWMVANELGWNEIDTRVFNGNKNEVEELIITSNTNREKTHAEKVNEALHMLNIIGNRQGKRNLPEGEKGSRYEIVANKLGAGFSKDNVAKLAKIQEHDNNNPEEQNKLIDLVKQGATINAVHNLLSNQSHEENDIEKIIENEGRYKLINEDCLISLSQMEDKFIDMVFTSPPYYKQRLYEGEGAKRNPNNIGEENSVEDYLNNLSKIGSEVFRILNNTGSFYLNIGDTIINGENLAIPELLLIEMKQIGFKLANRIVWRKKNPKPMILKSGLQPNYELIFHFVKSLDYKCRQLKWKSKDGLKVSRGICDRRIDGIKEKKGKILETPYKQFKTFFDENEGYTDVIKSAVATARNLSKIDAKLDHPAIYPETLPFIPLLQTTEVGDKVLDIFSGSSTFGVVANLFGREYFGIELNQEYHKVGAIRMEHIQKQINPEIYQELDSMAA
jgi:DNA modification methylase